MLLTLLSSQKCYFSGISNFGFSSLTLKTCEDDYKEVGVTPFLKSNRSLSNENIFNCYTLLTAAAAAKSLQSCPTLCDPIDSSPLGSSVSGILQARTLLTRKEQIVRLFFSPQTM